VQLEARALQIASWCRKERRVKYQYIGENFYTTHDQNVFGDERELLKHALSRWLHEIRANSRARLSANEKRDACVNYMNVRWSVGGHALSYMMYSRCCMVGT